jgi:hypothetical protein
VGGGSGEARCDAARTASHHLLQCAPVATFVAVDMVRLLLARSMMYFICCRSTSCANELCVMFRHPIPSLLPPSLAVQYAETYAWVGVSPGDVATARASTVEAQASLVATLGGSNFMKGDGLSTTRTGTKAVAAVTPAALTVSAITASTCDRLAWTEA